MNAFECLVKAGCLSSFGATTVQPPSGVTTTFQLLCAAGGLENVLLHIWQIPSQPPPLRRELEVSLFLGVLLAISPDLPGDDRRSSSFPLLNHHAVTRAQTCMQCVHKGALL
jgi:hypothetical protein